MAFLKAMSIFAMFALAFSSGSPPAWSADFETFNTKEVSEKCDNSSDCRVSCPADTKALHCACSGSSAVTPNYTSTGCKCAVLHNKKVSYKVTATCGTVLAYELAHNDCKHDDCSVNCPGKMKALGCGCSGSSYISSIKKVSDDTCNCYLKGGEGSHRVTVACYAEPDPTNFDLLIDPLSPVKASIIAIQSFGEKVAASGIPTEAKIVDPPAGEQVGAEAENSEEPVAKADLGKQIQAYGTSMITGENKLASIGPGATPITSAPSDAPKLPAPEGGESTYQLSGDSAGMKISTEPFAGFGSGSAAGVPSAASGFFVKPRNSNLEPQAQPRQVASANAFGKARSAKSQHKDETLQPLSRDQFFGSIGQNEEEDVSTSLFLRVSRQYKKASKELFVAQSR